MARDDFEDSVDALMLVAVFLRESGRRVANGTPLTAEDVAGYVARVRSFKQSCPGLNPRVARGLDAVVQGIRDDFDRQQLLGRHQP